MCLCLLSVDSDTYSIDSSRSNLHLNDLQRHGYGSRGDVYGGHVSATESSREDFHEEDEDVDSIGS